MPDDTLPERWGYFPDTPKLDHVDDENATLLAPFVYVDPLGVSWKAPRGMLFDGTSVPAPLWSLFRESPFTGRAAWAAIIHDAGCKGLVLVDGERLTPAGMRDGRVHATFYRGIRARGGDPLKAWAFYRAVWTVGMIRGGYTR